MNKRVTIAVGVGLLLAATLVLLPATASAATAPTPGEMGDITGQIANFFSYANTASQDLSAKLITDFAGYILTICVVIRIVMVVVPAVLEGDLSNFAGEMLKVAFIAIIVTTVFANWNGGPINIRKDSKAAFSELTNIIISSELPVVQAAGAKGCALSGASSTGGVSDAITMAAGAFECASGRLTDAAVAQFSVPLNSNMGIIVGGIEKVGAHVIAFLLMIVLLLVLLVVFIIMTVEAIMAWGHVIIPLTFGPIAIAFYPLNKQWAGNVISGIFGGFLAYAASLFVLLIVLSVFLGAMGSTTVYLQTLSHGNAADVGSFLGSTLGQVSGLALVGILLAYSGGAFVSAATSLVGGNDHFSRNRGMMAGAIAGFAGGKMASVGGAVASGGKAGLAKTGAAAAVAGGGIKNLATGHTAGKLAALKASRGARDAATAAANANRNRGIYTPKS